MHKISRFCILTLIFLPFAVGAQQFISPKKTTPGITMAVEINDSKDLDFIQNNLNRFYGVQKVRVNGLVDISAVASALSLLGDLEEVQLLKFTVQLNADDLEKL